MTFESISGDAENSQASGGVSRRSVLKVGAHAAWAVPLVQVVAAAPANAAVASGSKTSLQWLSLTGQYPGDQGPNNGKSLVVTASIKNSGAAPAATPQIVVELPTSLSNATVPSPPSGWTVTSSKTTHTFTANSSLAAGQTAGFTATFTLAIQTAPSFNLTATAGAGNATTVSNAANVLGLAILAITALSSALDPNKKVATLTSAVQNDSGSPQSATDVFLVVTMARGGVTPTVNGAEWKYDSASGTTYTFKRAGVLAAGAQTGTLTATFDYKSNNGSNTSFTLNGSAMGINALLVTKTATGQSA